MYLNSDNYNQNIQNTYGGQNSSWSGYRQYQGSTPIPESFYNQGGTPPGGPEPERRPPRRSKRAGTIAALLAVSMVSGMAGGGASYLILQSGQKDPFQETALVQEQEERPAQSSLVTADGSAGQGGGTGDIASIVATASNSVVEVSTEVTGYHPFFGEMTSAGSGSGVVLTEDGYIVTNDHVVEDASSITVRTADGEEYAAALIGTDAQSDLAVLKIDAKGLSPVTFADSDSVEVGDLAVAIGNPLGTLGGTVTDGIISAKDREITIGDETMSLLQTSAAVNPGNSGGGLFNGSGHLVGIVNAKSSGTDVEGLGFAIPSNTVRQVADDLMRYGYVTGRPELGISIVEISDLQTARRYRLTETGVYVASTTRDNGMESGDRIHSVNGEEITSAKQLSKIVASHEVGDVLEVVVKRGTSQKTLQVELGEQSPVFEEILPESAEL